MRRFAGLLALAAVLWGGAAATAEPIDDAVIWHPAPDLARSLPGACSAVQPDCLPDIMAKAGASPQAVAFARAVDGEGFADAFEEHGVVDLVTANFPFLANSNWRQFLVNGDPAVVALDDPERLATLDLDGNADYGRLIAAKPDAMLWPVAEVVGAEAVPDEGQRFNVYYPILDGCHACDVLGWANVAYRFDAAGKLTAVELQSVEAP